MTAAPETPPTSLAEYLDWLEYEWLPGTQRAADPWGRLRERQDALARLTVISGDLDEQGGAS